MAQSFTRRQPLLQLLASLAFVAIGISMIREGELVPVAWFFTVFFALAALACAYMAVTGKPYIVRPEETRIVPEPGGFAVLTTRGRRLPVRWAGVRRVHAYKRDLFTVDEICVAFESDDLAGVLEVSEEWPGFADLFGPMESELGVSPGWYMEIMSPPFETMHRVLFERAEAAAPETRPAG